MRIPLAILTASLIALLIIPGCARRAEYPPYDAPGNVLSLHGDVDFTPKQRAWIGEAVSNLNTQSRGLFDVSIVFDVDARSEAGAKEHQLDDVLIQEDSETPSVVMLEAQMGTELLGVTLNTRDDARAGNRTFLITGRLRMEADFVSVTMHELLHQLGAKHVVDPDALMAPGTLPGVPLPTCLHKDDVEEICRVYGCLPERIGWCE